MRFFVIFLPEYKRWITVILDGQRQIGFIKLNPILTLDEVKDRTIDMACDQVLGEVDFSQWRSNIAPLGLIDLSGAYELKLWDDEGMMPTLQWQGGSNPSAHNFNRYIHFNSGIII